MRSAIELPTQLRGRLLAPAALITPDYLKRLIVVAGCIENNEIRLEVIAPGTSLAGLHSALRTRLEQAYLYSGFISHVDVSDNLVTLTPGPQTQLSEASLDQVLQQTTLQLPLCLPFQQHRIFAVPQGTLLAFARWQHWTTGLGLSFDFPDGFTRDLSVPRPDLLAALITNDLTHIGIRLYVDTTGGNHTKDPVHINVRFDPERRRPSDRVRRQMINLVIQATGYRLFLPEAAEETEIVFAPDRAYEPLEP